MTGSSMNRLDPISIEILWNALRSVTDESFVALMKSAYSTNIKERNDHSTAIVDARGRLIVQAAQSLPIHVASMTGLMECLLRKYGNAIRDGDLFVANDPHVAGGTHLPDINMAKPVFRDGELVAFVCNIAHHADVGGMAPGSMAGGMSEIFQEGLRIPVIRLFRDGELDSDLLDLLLLNVRVPEERRGDYYAQVAACRLGERRLQEIIDGEGVARLERAFEEIISRTATRMRAAIAEIPDGRYAFEDVMDDDGLGSVDIPIRLVIRVDGDVVRRAGHRPTLGAADQALVGRLLEEARAAGLEPPAVREWAERVGASPEHLRELLAHLEREGQLVRAPGDLWFDRAAVDALRERVEAHLREHGRLETPAYKTLIGTTRRTAVRLMELFDAQRVTIRRGDARLLRSPRER